MELLELKEFLEHGLAVFETVFFDEGDFVLGLGFVFGNIILALLEVGLFLELELGFVLVDFELDGLVHLVDLLLVLLNLELELQDLVLLLL
jgi:hypothetical protein